jgi:tetratricopeptide (TPR) repeat protein
MPDLVLRLEQGLVGRLVGRTRISVEEPSEPTTSPSRFYDPPDDYPPTDYDQEDVNVDALVSWIASCISESIWDVIARMYPLESDDILRVIITASDRLQAKMMVAPWEFLELAGIKQKPPYYERLSLIRVLSTREPPAEPTPVGETIRVAVTWANPRGDIPELKEHLEDVRAIARDHPRELNLIGPIEFTTVQSVLQSLAGKHPHVCYHIGHAVQPAGEKVKLLIGTTASPTECDVEQYRELLQQIGPPRVLLLSACAAAVGYSPNAYLGAALSCASQIDAAITMQAPVPASAAMRFATSLFTSLASGVGLAECLKRGRIAIQRHERVTPGLDPSFTNTIPVLVQRTRQDRIFIIDKSGRELNQLLTSLKQALERVDPYLKRSHDTAILDALATPVAERRVTIVNGPRSTGKSTSIRRMIRDLLNKDRFDAGERYLYYEVQATTLPSGDRDDKIAALLTSFASQSSLTRGFKRKLTDRKTDVVSDAVAVLVGWLREEHDQGKKYSVCLDNLPPDLAHAIARKASAVLDDFGALLLVTDEATLDEALPINVISVSSLAREEIRTALLEARRTPNGSLVDNILKLTNGIPYLVAGYLRGGCLIGPPLSDLGEAYLRDFAPTLSREEEHELSFAAYCDISIPAYLFEQSALAKLVAKRSLLIMSEADSYHIPEVLRGPLKQRFTGQAVHIHERAFNGFIDIAERHEASRDEITFQVVTRWLQEALRHGLSMMKLLSDDLLRDARDTIRALANKLHDRYLNEADEVGPATAMWEEYRAVVQSAGFYDDRGSDARYADCLMRMGKYDDADGLLEAVTSSKELDQIQLTALFLRSNLIKERGGGFVERVELLSEALDVAKKLQGSEVDQQWIDQQLASLEHALGNALGYGDDANPEEALKHLGEAQRLFEGLGDPLQFRTIAEQIEVKRYNASRDRMKFTDEDRGSAIKILQANFRKLITRAMRYDTILHLYELGRLEVEAKRQAEWFEQAYKRAGEAYAPLGLHAAINWRISEIEADLVPFKDAAVELKAHTEKLKSWNSSAWSRRMRRKAWEFLGERYERCGALQDAFAALSEAWAAVLEIRNFGEGGQDSSRRRSIACRFGMLALKCDKPDVAHKLVTELCGDDGARRARSMSSSELQQCFLRAMEDA